MASKSNPVTLFMRNCAWLALFTIVMGCEKEETKPYLNAGFNDSIDYISMNDPEYVFSLIRFNYEYLTFQWGCTGVSVMC
jgi:hypothetical protein